MDGTIRVALRARPSMDTGEVIGGFTLAVTDFARVQWNDGSVTDEATDDLVQL